MSKFITVVLAITIVGFIIYAVAANGPRDNSLEDTNNTNLYSENGEQNEGVGEESLPDEININNDNNMSDNKIVTFNTSAGSFKIELFLDKVPQTAGNFVKLASEGFYDGTRFHRIIDGFMIQGGDPLSRDEDARAMWGTGDPGYKFDDEFGEGLSNVAGTISMANSGPNTNGSQFFINVADNTFLDYDKEPLTSKHSVFGQVVDGLDVVVAISKTATGPGDRPLDDVIVESVVVE